MPPFALPFWASFIWDLVGPVIALFPTGTRLGVTDQRHMTNRSAVDLGYPPISRGPFGSPAESCFSTFYLARDIRCETRNRADKQFMIQLPVPSGKPVEEGI